MLGKMGISGYTIKDWNTYGWGEDNYYYWCIQSSNISLANLDHKYITKEKLLDMYKKLIFDSKTRIEFTNENEGQIRVKYNIEVSNALFGQGIKTTSMQHIKALSSISNNGYIITNNNR